MVRFLDETGLAEAAEHLWQRFWPELGPLDVRLRLSHRLVGKAGYYNPSERLIVLSRPYADHYGESEVLATLLHELVHHRVHLTFGNRVRPHGQEFRAEMLRVGCPRYCYDTTRLKRLLFVCPSCGREFGRERRPPRSGIACGPCCKRYAGGRFDARFRLVAHGQRRGHPSVRRR